jgi:hypothetical protein
MWAAKRRVVRARAKGTAVLLSAPGEKAVAVAWGSPAVGATNRNKDMRGGAAHLHRTLQLSVLRDHAFNRGARGVRSGSKVKFTGLTQTLGQLITASNRDSQSNCWVNLKIVGQPSEFQVNRQFRLGATREGCLEPAPSPLKLGPLRSPGRHSRRRRQPWSHSGRNRRHTRRRPGGARYPRNRTR